MPILKIRKNNKWVEVRGATSDGASADNTPKLTTVTILASGWEGTSSPYSQTVSANGVSENSKLDLQPTPAQTIELQEAEISLMAANDNGVVTIYAIGDKPISDMTMQMLITEVTVV